MGSFVWYRFLLSVASPGAATIGYATLLTNIETIFGQPDPLKSIYGHLESATIQSLIWFVISATIVGFIIDNIRYNMLVHFRWFMKCCGYSVRRFNARDDYSWMVRDSYLTNFYCLKADFYSSHQFCANTGLGFLLAFLYGWYYEQWSIASLTATSIMVIVLTIGAAQCYTVFYDGVDGLRSTHNTESKTRTTRPRSPRQRQPGQRRHRPATNKAESVPGVDTPIEREQLPLSKPPNSESLSSTKDRMTSRNQRSVQGRHKFVPATPLEERRRKQYERLAMHKPRYKWRP